MAKKRTKKYLKKLDKALQESNRYLAGIMDIMTWKKMKEDKKNAFWQNTHIETLPYTEAKRRGLI